jgi:very-short-patch-repair endonuclease
VRFSHRLVIEVDGGQHADVTDYDERRTEFLNREGSRVLRFWNNEVLQNREGVCERILEVLSEPHPSPLVGEEGAHGEAMGR